MRNPFLLTMLILALSVSCSKEPTPENSELYLHYELLGKKVDIYPIIRLNAILWRAKSIMCQDSTCDMTVAFSAEEVDGASSIHLSFNSIVDTNYLVNDTFNKRFKTLESFASGLAAGKADFCPNGILPCFNVQIDVNGTSWSTQRGWVLRSGGIAGDPFNSVNITFIKKFSLNDTNPDDFEYYEQLKRDSIEHVIQLDMTFQLKMLNDYATDSLLVTNGRAKIFLVN